MSKELPPPATKNSGKRELWEELEFARAEIDQQQCIMNDWRDRVARLEAEVDGLRYQMSVIRTVLTADVPQTR